jgi:hypothetical protein
MAAPKVVCRICSTDPRKQEALIISFLGSVEHIRQTTFGAAITRLLLSGYCVLVLLTGSRFNISTQKRTLEKFPNK